jgi:hypothetical protein
MPRVSNNNGHCQQKLRTLKKSQLFGGGGGGGGGVSLMQSLHGMNFLFQTVLFLFFSDVTGNAVMHCSRSSRNVSE